MECSVLTLFCLLWWAGITCCSLHLEVASSIIKEPSGGWKTIWTTLVSKALAFQCGLWQGLC